MHNLSWARRRQIYIATGLTLFFVTIVSVLLFTFLYKPANCFDEKQNGAETGVDCGGGCARICEADARAIAVQWVRIFKIRDGVYSAVARIENPAINAIAENVPYTFTLKDASGATVATRSGNTFIPSRQSFVVFEGTIQSPQEPQTVEFKFDRTPVFERSDYIQPEVVVVSKELINQDTSPRLPATVRNPNIVDVEDITLSALIYDDEGNAVQVSQTYIEKIQAGQSMEVVFTWPNPISLKSRVCSTPVDTALVIDRSGSMEYLGLNPPQPLTDVKEAASFFVDNLSQNDQASIVSFANEASAPIDTMLSSNFSAIMRAIQNITITPPSNTQNTNLGDGIAKGSVELLSPRAKNTGKILIALTDGVATRPQRAGNPTYPESYALAVAEEAKNAGIRIFTIGLGRDLNQQFLRNVASAPSDFYLAPTADDLEGIYRDIATAMCVRKPTALEIVPSIPR